METLAISAANLNTIEKNLNHVADGLTAVVSNVTNVNSKINKVEGQVADLNDEIKNLVSEIRETTIISNARQSIMYNNEQIDKKFNYYDNVRRTTISLLDAVLNSSISRKSLYELNQQVLLNNPNYWLSNALSAITFWLLDDKESTYKEVNNALKKNKKKTSLFFTYVNIKLGRESTAINWLKNYLSYLNPLELDKDFITILDLASTGGLNNTGRELVLNKINDWFLRIKNEEDIKSKNKDIWKEFILEKQDNNIRMPYLELFSQDVNKLKDNLATTSSYYNVLNYFNGIMNKGNSNKMIDNVLETLIFDYEDNEQVYQLDNLRNNLIIACNGDTKEADKLFKRQESMYNDKVDLITILSNIVIFDTVYKVSGETKKIALSLIKDYVIETYVDINSSINYDNIPLDVNGYMFSVSDDINRDLIDKGLDSYVSNNISGDDKDLTIILIILNILGIIGIFVTLNSKILSTILIIFILFGDVFLMMKMNKRNRLRMEQRKVLKDSINNMVQRVLAEIVDYRSMINDDKLEYEKLINFLNNLNANNYFKSNNERNIRIG